MNTQEQFDAAYRAAQPVEVQLALTIRDFGERSMALENLASQVEADEKSAKFLIDRQIMINADSPFLVMWARHAYGYTWVESVGNANPPLIDLPPGFVGIAGRKTYDPHNPPANTILVPDPVTCDLAVWYPPAIKPVPPLPPPPLPAGPYVGAESHDLETLLKMTPVYAALNTVEANALPDGFETTEEGKTFVKAKYFTFATTIPYFTPKG